MATTTVREVRYKTPNRCLYVDLHLCGCNASPTRGNSGCSCGRWGLCCVAIIITLVVLAAIAAIVLLVLYFTTELLPFHYDGRVSYVDTPMGRIQGSIVTSAGGNDVEEYLGIPYAKPPINELRFANPVKLEKFEQDPLIADSHSASCMQGFDNSQGDFWGTQMWNPPGKVSEDCLYLSVWSPTPQKDKLRPVMLWIFGGGFTSGTSSLDVYDGKVLAAYGDVVVVSFNYRVGALGYLSTGDGRIKGNFGQMDQVMVLKWVNENIASFGGDPDQVTLFGESAGAASVGYHFLSTLTQNLFQRAIFQSGSPNSHWSYQTPEQCARYSGELFKALNCTHDDLMPCLRSLDAQTIVDVQWVSGDFLVFPYVPVIDGEYLTDTPYNIIKKRLIPKKDVIIGSNKDEGSFWLLYYIQTVSKDTESLHSYSQFLEAVNNIAYDLNEDNLERVKKLYTDLQIKDTSDQAANRDAVDRVAGDRSFTCPAYDLAKDLANQGGNVYYYYLTHRASNELWPDWMGVIHGGDIQWFFGQPLAEQTHMKNFNEGEKEFSRTIMSYITNFAVSGDPNAEGLPPWSKFEGPEYQYQEWRGPNDMRTNSTFREPFCEVWRRLNRDWYEGREI